MLHRTCLAELLAGTVKMVETRSMTEAHCATEWVDGCVEKCVRVRVSEQRVRVCAFEREIKHHVKDI